MDENANGATSAPFHPNPYLASGPRRNPSDMRVQSGYPIWNLIDGWMGVGYDDEAMIRDYKLDPAEWAAAKQYYLDHKPMIDARIIAHHHESPARRRRAADALGRGVLRVGRAGQRPDGSGWDARIVAALLVDEGIGRDLVQALVAQGFVAHHWLEFGPKGSHDSLVFAEARRRGLTVFRGHFLT